MSIPFCFIVFSSSSFSKVSTAASKNYHEEQPFVEDSSIFCINPLSHSMSCHTPWNVQSNVNMQVVTDSEIQHTRGYNTSTQSESIQEENVNLLALNWISCYICIPMGLAIQWLVIPFPNLFSHCNNTLDAKQRRKRNLSTSERYNTEIGLKLFSSESITPELTNCKHTEAH